MTYGGCPVRYAPDPRGRVFSRLFAGIGDARATRMSKLRLLAVQALALQALAACSHEIEGPAPVVQGLDPSIVCTEQLVTPVRINGSGLSPLAEEALTPDPLLALPTVTLQRTADLSGGAQTGAEIEIPDDPSNTAASRVRWMSQQQMTFDVYPELALQPGIYSVEVANANGQTFVRAGALAAVPPPVITDVQPNPVCNAQGTSILTLTGTGFLVIGETRPSVTIDGMAATVTEVGGCSDIVNSPTAARTCTSITISVPQGTLTVGDHSVAVTNPAPAACSTAMPFTLTVVPPPTVTAIQPAVICSGGGDLVITGMDFSSDPRVIIGGVEATVRTATPTRIDVTLGAIPPGVHDVTVDNQNGCSDTLEDALRVTPGPAVYFVDPPTVYNGISLQATIYVTGLINAPQSVTIRPSGGGEARPLEVTFDPARPNRILAVVPAGLAAGNWDVVVTDGLCSATLPNGLFVVSTLTVAIDDVVPPFAWTSDDTAVTVNATDPAPTGQVQFQATPRAYLNPRGGAATRLARPLEAVAFVNPGRLTAVVPAGLTAGEYDLIVVNPDRTVGLLSDSFLVTAAGAPPPVVDTITPGSVINQPAQAVTILGANFRAPGVTATCDDDAGAVQVIEGTVGAVTGGSIGATFNMGALSSAVCVVRVTNSDGTYVDFSALAVSNPAQNLPATVADESMMTARRALSSVAARVTSQARYLYAIGGDSGSDAMPLASIEAAPVSLFGDLDPFFTLPQGLPAARTLAGSAVIGRFIYLLGGRLAAGPTGSVLRAQILDPRAAPDITDLDLVPGEGMGVDPGLFYYRVSAVMGAANASNPGGETLASDPLGVVIPPLPGKVRLTLIWAAVPGAASYRIYRTPAAGMLVGTARLVGTSTTASFTDTGAAPAGNAPPPLPEGALGAWHEVGPMPTPREGLGVAVAADPDAGGAFFLYAIGGRSGGTTALASYTFARVAVAADGSQTVSAWAPDAGFLATPRWQLSAIGMDNARASAIAEGDTWVYAVSGYNGAASQYVSEVTAGLVTGDGTFEPVYSVDAPSNQAGYGLAGANNFLFIFGGGSSPATTSRSGSICGMGASGCSPQVPDPPDIGTWDNLGFGLRQARWLPGSALESAFIFLVGGASDTMAATTTTERTHW
jgi:hypothetical protein